MFRFLTVLFILLSGSGCKTPANKPPEEIFRPGWSGLDAKKIPVKFGQVLAFKFDSLEIKAVVLDFDTEDGEVWVGLCFIENNRLFGRQIPSGMVFTDCVDLLDLTYLNLSELKGYQALQTIRVDKEKVGIGGFSPVNDLADLKISYGTEIERRKKKQTPCEKAFVLEAVRQCYFDIDKIRFGFQAAKPL